MANESTVAATSDIEQAAQKFTQWIVLDPAKGAGQIRPGKRYLLKNGTNRHFLYYKRQGTFGGINLGFTDDAEPSTAAKVVHWEFANRGRTPVTYGEPVAIRCKDDWLYYGHRTTGINLKWSDNPVYEWRLYGGRPGTPVTTRDWLCIWNLHGQHGEPLVYFQREIGGNIGWPSSQTILQQGLDWAKEAVQEAVADYFKGQAGGR